MSSVNPKLIVLPRARKDFDRPKAQVFEVVVQKRATARRGPRGRVLLFPFRVVCFFCCFFQRVLRSSASVLN